MRYAVYLTPPEGSPLERTAARWLGRSPFRSGTTHPAAPPAADPEGPARYGFHATLRAPFRLGDGTSERALIEAFAAAYEGQAGLAPRLSIGRLSGFLAFLAPDDDGTTAAARAAVETFEPFRAAMSEAERARRHPERLDPAALALLDRWGYPWVMERFRFHMTLSGSLAAADVEMLRRRAEAHFEGLDGRPHALVHALYRETAPDEPFRIIAVQRTVDQ